MQSIGVPVGQGEGGMAPTWHTPNLLGATQARGHTVLLRGRLRPR